MAWRDETARLPGLEVSRPTAKVFRSREAMQRFLARLMPGRAPAPPPIDFRRREALLVGPGARSSTGYRVEIVRVRERGGRIRVVARERSPTVRDPGTPRLTYPYRLLTLARSTAPIEVTWEGRE